MLLIGRRGRMTACALEDRVIVRVGVACRANPVRIAVIQRKECVVLRGECRRNPGSCCMTRRTRCRPACRHMVRIGRSGEISLVTRIAGRWGPCEHIVDVALDAVDTDVRSREGERGVVVVERRSGPCRRRMAGIAGGRESRSGVVRIGRSIPVSLVTAKACGRQRRVVVIRMALGTGNSRVRTGQREPRVVVVKRRWAPAACRVTNRAVGRESRGGVVGICGSGVIRLVARVAGRRRVCVVVICVALGAAQRRVQARQWIVRILRMVEVDICPVRRRMARFARGRECGRGVVRVRRSRPVSAMASVTIRRQGRVVIVGVALSTRHSGVRPGQREDRCVVKRRGSPRHGCVA